MGNSGTQGEDTRGSFGFGEQIAGTFPFGFGPAIAESMPWSNTIVATHVDKLFWKLMQEETHSSRAMLWRSMKVKAAEAFGF